MYGSWCLLRQDLISAIRYSGEWSGGGDMPEAEVDMMEVRDWSRDVRSRGMKPGNDGVPPTTKIEDIITGRRSMGS